MICRLLIILTLSLLTCKTIQGQQPVFSQFYNAGMFLNPALAGMEKDILVGFNYRSQWSSAHIPFSTFQLSYMHPLIDPARRSRHIGGIGGSLLSDASGENNEFRQIGAFATGAYNLHLNKYGTSVISVGIQAGVIQKRIDPAAFQWNSQYNPLLGYDDTIIPSGMTETDQVWYPIVSAGALWSMRLKKRYAKTQFSIYQGISAASLNTPNTALFDQENGNIPVTLRIHGGVEIYMTSNFSMSPHYLLQKEGEYFQINTGALFSYYLTDRHAASPTILMAGAWYRLEDAAIFSIGFEFSNVRITGSYDRNVHSLSRYFGNAASFELSLQWRVIRHSSLQRYGTPMI